jgi:hypothetical protein
LSASLCFNTEHRAGRSTEDTCASTTINRVHGLCVYKDAYPMCLCRYSMGTRLVRRGHPDKSEHRSLSRSQRRRERAAQHAARQIADKVCYIASRAKPSKARSSATRRLDSYTGGGVADPGAVAARALALNAASAAAGPPAEYLWPAADAPPAPKQQPSTWTKPP